MSGRTTGGPGDWNGNGVGAEGGGARPGEGGAGGIVRQALPGDGAIDLGEGGGAIGARGPGSAPTATDAWSVTLDSIGASFTTDPRPGHALRTALNYDPAGSVVCFAEGTRILTPRGEVPVERLRVGDLVVTPRAAAAFAPLVWVGRLQVDLTRQRFRGDAAPVLVKAGAVAEGVPFRDLHVSPNHALLVDGVLVPARLLVNGLTIIHQRWWREATYLHLELDRHGLLVSEGALTESYLDDGNRHLFDTPGLVPFDAGFAARRGGTAEPCAPVLREGDERLREIRMRLGRRAGFLQARRRPG